MTMVVTTSGVDDVVGWSDDVDVVVGVSEVEVGVVEVVVGVVLLASGVLLVTASDVVEDSDDVVEVSVGVASVEDDVLVGVVDASAVVDSVSEAAALLLEACAAPAEDDMMRSDERTTGGRVVVRGLEYEVPYGRAQKPATTQIHPIEGKKKNSIRWLNRSNRASRCSCSPDNNQTWEERNIIQQAFVFGDTSEGNW